MIKIVAIQSPNGVLITDNVDNQNYFNTQLASKIINGNIAKKSFHKDWFIVEGEVKSIQQKRSGNIINERYILINPELASDKIRPEFNKFDVYSHYDDDEDKTIWKNNFGTIASLYKYTYDREPDYLEDLEFECITLCNLSELPKLTSFSYPAQIGQYRYDGMGTITEKSLKFNLIDEIIFPKPLLENRPCSLSSQDTYKIIREHVKLNINPNYAEITSDYDFCFKVEKKIPLHEIETYQVNVNLFTKKKAKYETRYRKFRKVQVFEMTHAGQNNGRGYDKYTVIQGIKGDNPEDLQNKLDRYLENLMNIINEPLHDCPHCAGMGVILNDKKEIL